MSSLSRKGTQIMTTKASSGGAYVASLVVCAVPCVIYEVRGYSSKASTQAIQVHDKATLPANAVVPDDVVAAGATNNFYISYPNGRQMANGIVLCNSSTFPTKTIGAADCFFSCEYALL